jgi:hypothetical protein
MRVRCALVRGINTLVCQGTADEAMDLESDHRSNALFSPKVGDVALPS